MTRKKFIARSTYLFGNTVVFSTLGSNSQRCESGVKDSGKMKFTPDGHKILEVLVDTIKPDDGVVGAKEAGVAAFVALMVYE